MTQLTGDWYRNPETQAVLKALQAGGHQAYLVGGCVRNDLLGVAVSDMDIATDAVPDEVVALAEAAGLKPVPTGIEHGTITIVARGIPHEVTTFRADVETDGRRAVVAFSKDIVEDAKRRDLTMNALYADASGRVHDPLNGLPDLRARRVRFILNAADRIREDYLRSLRFFRFAAWYGDPEQGFDPEALAAIADNLEGLDTLSRERVGAEILKLFSAPDPAPAAAVMEQTGVLRVIMPGATTRSLAPLIHHEAALGLAPEPLRRIAALGYGDGASLRLSKAQQRQLALLLDLVGGTDGPNALGYVHGAEVALSVLLLRAAMLEVAPDPDWPRITAEAASREFPIRAADLMPALTGPALGAKLKELQDRWIASDFTLDRQALLRQS
ncbi:poly(A) polymerase [Primorskyibacter sedentarius]|uniref:Poly(A) polymerase n=1 Tax=Primorskyibacter sedentarius TaxID=745311 RepID=A0A4R3JJM4_9RHOB|nr:CCA tRNA nucleotidyltransferase [Primorskyibacter sedentarius]TCS66352.1 poly(A) polymerase [Primorskyibacter sedentarius]